MTGHFATRLLDDAGNFLPQTDRYNSRQICLRPLHKCRGSSVSRTPSKLYRQAPELAAHAAQFSVNGNEVTFGTIGNAGCAEGLFWESLNAVGVLQVPVVLSVWDDGFGISVPNAFQMTKGDISRILEGFKHPRRRTAGHQHLYRQGLGLSRIVFHLHRGSGPRS
jgi:hypothetical protein